MQYQVEIETNQKDTKSNKNLVSIIMPIRNAEYHLDACIQSIVSQTYSHWELLAVNDHSDDNTEALLSLWAKKDPRIKPLSNKGKGIIDALKTAFRASSGQYVHRMDSDDLMPMNKLKLMLGGLKTSDCQVVTGKVKYFGQELKGGYLNYEQWLNAIKEERFWEEIFLECVLASPCWMMKKELFSEYINAPELSYPEDYYLAFFLASKGVKVRKLSNYLHLWRDHSTRASRNDINYQEQSFLPQKIHFFKKMALDSERKLILWGAGRKGKKLAKALIGEGIKFVWLSNNPKKINHNIYGVIVASADDCSFEVDQHQVIIAFSGPQEKAEAEVFLANKKMKKGIDLFSFY